ncbi:unnamed protein product [Rhizophagus irregularis]|nr:unnamed protein product [Rhizophagus irregularis]CAB5306231.1 unnamed protein product [Rhizophagus irregularis]
MKIFGCIFLYTHKAKKKDLCCFQYLGFQLDFLFKKKTILGKFNYCCSKNTFLEKIKKEKSYIYFTG